MLNNETKRGTYCAKLLNPTGLYETVRSFIEENQPCNIREIYEGVPFAEASIRVAVSALRQQHKLVYISDWEWDESSLIIRCLAKYSLGRGVEPPKPKKRTQYQHQKRHREKSTDKSTVFLT